MKKFYIAAIAACAIFVQSGAFASETGVQQLIKKCESAAKARGISSAPCSCTLSRMQNSGYSDEEIVTFAQPNFKPQTPYEIKRHTEYGLDIRLAAGICR